MLPMGWNQIRQTRLLDMQPHPMPFGQHQQMIPNQQQYDIYHQPPMVPQHQMFQPHIQVLGSYGIHGAQTLMSNPQKPPEPEGPPPPSPPAPLPTGEVIPPPPPDDGKWWESEMKNLPNKQQKHELERMVGEKWFQTMNTSQQIECWQHKLQLLNKQKKDGGSSRIPKPPPITPAPSVNAPSSLKAQQPSLQKGNGDLELLKVKEEETSIKQQVLTFERQYEEWKKQFDDWKDKHKGHPNKQQFAQYESQWMTWQKQMSSQKIEYETNLKRVQTKIQELERRKLETQGDTSGRTAFERSNEEILVKQEPDQFPGVQKPPQQSQNFEQRPKIGHGFNTEQRPRFDGPNNHGERFGRPEFGNNQSGFNQIPQYDNDQGPGFGQRPQFHNDQDLGFNRTPQFDNDQGPGFNQGTHFSNGQQGSGFNQRSQFNSNQGPGFNQRLRFNNDPGPSFNQRPRFDKNQISGINEWPRFDENQASGFHQRPQFDNNRVTGFNQRPRFSSPGVGDNSFRQRAPGAQTADQGPRFSNNPCLRFFENQERNNGSRQRFPGPKGGRPRFGDEWQPRGPHPKGPLGPRFRNKLPPHMGEEEEFQDDWQEEENMEEDDFEGNFFGGNQGSRGPHLGFGPRASTRGRFLSATHRPLRPGSIGENPQFRGPRPRFPTLDSTPVRHIPGPRGPQPPPQNKGNFTEDDLPGDDHFYVEQNESNTEKERKEGDEKTSSELDPAVKEKDSSTKNNWRVSRDMVPMEFGSKQKKDRKNKHEAFTFHDALEDGGDWDGINQEEGLEESVEDKKKKEDVNPEDDYSHYETDDYMLEMERRLPVGRGLPLRGGRGRGGPHRGRGFHNRAWDRELDFENDFVLDDITKPSNLLMREEQRFSIETTRRQGSLRGLVRGAHRSISRGAHRDLLPTTHRDLMDARDHPRRDSLEAQLSSNETPTSSSRTTPPTSASTSLDTKAIMQKAKELSNLDIKNLLSAVKSIKGTDVSKSEGTPASASVSGSDEGKIQDLPDASGRDEEAALLARERHYEELARGFEPSIRRPESSLLGRDRLPDVDLDIADRHSRDRISGADLGSQLSRDRVADAGLGRQFRRDRITDADLIAAGIDPTSLGLRDEELLLQDFLLNPSLRDPIHQPSARDRLLDPLLQESYLERDLLMREIQEMRKREEARQREEVLREKELRESLAKPILQAQKIVETIDYSHGLKDKGKEEGKSGERGISPPQGSPGQNPAYRGRGPYPDFDADRRRFPPMSMDERMRMRERGVDDRHFMDHRFPPQPMDERMVRERGMWPSRRSSSPYDPNSSVVVADDIGEALQKHWQLLDRERQSMERKRTSMERRRNSLEKTRSSREREEERRDRERSLERLRRMERELKDRERMLNEREKRLKSPKRSRDLRDRGSWRPEGGSRAKTPPRRRYEEEPRSRDRDRRFRSPSPRRRRAWSPHDRRGRSPQNRSPRRSPIRGRDSRDKRRFTSPSGDPSSTRSPRPPRPKEIKPVCVCVEDLLNDPARQQRPKRIVIILRGLPGSGKSHIAKLIRDKESAKGVTPRLLGLDDYFMVENEKYEKDPDTGKIVKRKVHEYEYEAAMEPRYRESLLKAFKKTLEDGFFNFVIVDAVNDKVSHFSEFWTAAKKCIFEVYVAELTADVHVCVKRNTHKRELSEIQEISNNWEETPPHMIRLDVRQMLQDSEIQEVEMGDITDDENESDNKNQKLTPEQMAGLPQSKWELMEANERTRLDKLDGIKKKKLTSSQQDMAEFLSVTDDYVQRSSAPGKKRVRWADIEERSTQQRLREVGFVVGQTDWNRLVDGSTHASAALNRTKFI